MAFHLYENVWETTSTTGTGDITLAGAVTGWRSFSSQFADGDTMFYTLYDGTNFEAGIGTYHSGTNSISRTTVVRSTNSNTAVSWGAGQRQIACSPPGFAFEGVLAAMAGTVGYPKQTAGSSSGTPAAFSVDAAGQLLATATNDNASAGKLGEYTSTVVLTASQVALSSGAAKDVATLSLTAGDWDVWGEVWFNAASGTTTSNTVAAIGSSANTLPTTPGDAIAYTQLQDAVPASAGQTVGTGVARWSNSGTVTAHLVAFATFAVSTMAAYGKIAARRVR